MGVDHPLVGSLPWKNKVNEKIKKLITYIYGESFSEAHFKALLTKLEQAAVAITEKRKSGWDEKDVVLITYADQFTAAGRDALPLFTRFYNVRAIASTMRVSV